MGFKISETKFGSCFVWLFFDFLQLLQIYLKVECIFVDGCVKKHEKKNRENGLDLPSLVKFYWSHPWNLLYWHLLIQLVSFHVYHTRLGKSILGDKNKWDQFEYYLYLSMTSSYYAIEWRFGETHPMVLVRLEVSSRATWIFPLSSELVPTIAPTATVISTPPKAVTANSTSTRGPASAAGAIASNCKKKWLISVG